MTILIPAFEPNENMLVLLSKLIHQTDQRIVVVDDGSGDTYRPLFDKAEEMGCTVLRHPENKGKGEALKTGFRWILEHDEQEGVVCADCDGQHSCEDIDKIARTVRENPGDVVLGARKFTGNVPLRSRMGNTITRYAFSLATGCMIRDTQTGLRGYSADLLPWLCRVGGSRFEYEIRVLLEAQKEGYTCQEIPIETIYERSPVSHFRTVVDAYYVYVPLLKFSASSMFCALLDFCLLVLFKLLTNSLLFSVVCSRVISSTSNYLLNRHLVFKAPKQESAIYPVKYFSLAAAILLCNYCFMVVFTVNLKLALVPAKIITECVLYFASYWVQKKFVFRTISK